MTAGCLFLGQVADHLTTLEIACNRCERRGRASVARLLAEHGPMMPVPALLALLSADCPKRQAGRVPDICGACFPELPGVFMSGSAG